MGTKSSQDLYFSHSATIMAFDMNCGLLWKKRLEKKRVPMRGSSDTAISAETRSDRVRALSLEQVEWLEYPKLMIRDFDGQSGRELSAQPAIGYSNISGMFGPWWMTWAGQHELVVLFRRGYSGISIARFSLMADKLTKTDIIAVARRNAPEVQKCKTGTEASGTIKVRLTVANTGQVTKATVQGTEFAGTPLAQCVEAKVGDFRFPTFRKGPMNFTLPFAL